MRRRQLLRQDSVVSARGRARAALHQAKDPGRTRAQTGNAKPPPGGFFVAYKRPPQKLLRAAGPGNLGCPDEKVRTSVKSTQKPDRDQAQAAKYLGKSVETLRRWRREGAGPAYAEVGGTPRYSLASLDDWLRGRTVVPRRRRAERPLILEGATA